MAKFNIIKLHFQTPYHIGLGRSSYDTASSDLHSDTITSAMAALLAQSGASSEEVFSFLNSFVMSSAFPFEKQMYFLPRPLSVSSFGVEGTDGAKYRKALKKVRYVESNVWNELISGNKLDLSENQLQGAFLVSKGCDEFKAPFRKQVSQRVLVPRDGEDDSDPFYFEWVYFDTFNDCGLYVIVDANEEIYPILLSLMKQLGESGIGTDKSVGGGQFLVSEDSIELPDTKAEAWLSLSLYLPRQEELTPDLLKKSSYNMLLRGGYLAGSNQERFRHLWKKSIYMYEEGSTIVSEQCPEGAIVDLRPEWNEPSMHSVYRSGKALFVPIKL